MLLTGDDDGVIKLWDLRKKKMCFEWKENEDFISSLTIDEESNLALATGGDGYLSVIHLRRGDLEARSDNVEDELLSLAIIKNKKKVVTGTQSGVLAIWNWGDWGDMKDRYPGHPHSIDTMVQLNENMIATGSSDGLIR